MNGDDAEKKSRGAPWRTVAHRGALTLTRRVKSPQADCTNTTGWEV